MKPPRTEVLVGWGGAHRSRSLVFRVDDEEDVARATLEARERGLSITARGGGLSYGDAALNEGGAVLDLSGMRRTLSFDAEAGRVRAQAGATIGDIWRHVVGSGYWPPVVPGSMHATLGGCVAMDVHGKNHVRAGAFGRYVAGVRLVDGDGRAQTVRRGESREASGRELSSIVGAQGLTGTLVEVEIELRRIASGTLEVRGECTPDLAATFEALDRALERSEHAVAWIDAFGARAGRGVVHRADPGPPVEGRGGSSLAPDQQSLPRRLGGVVPRGQLWRLLRLLTNRPGIRLLNAVRYHTSRMRSRGAARVPHARYHFLLDGIPEWRRSYGPGGLMQYQLFVPREAAQPAFAELLRLQRAAGLPSFLGVLKRHTREPSAAGYHVDGYSLALDFPAGAAGRRDRLLELLGAFEAVRRDHDGRIYAAKDAVGRGSLPPVRDPAFSSDLVRRWSEE